MAVARVLEKDPRLCPIEGCRKVRPRGEETCFDHIDIEELERDIARPQDDDDEEFPTLVPVRTEDAPAREEREEEVREMSKSDRTSTDGPKCPSCGKQYGSGTNGPAFLARHVATCKGPVKKEGRIAAAAPSEARRPDPPRAKPSRKRSAVKRDYKAERERRNARIAGKDTRRQQKVESARPSPVMSAISPAQIIAACEVEIKKLQDLMAAAKAFAQ